MFAAWIDDGGPAVTGHREKHLPAPAEGKGSEKGMTRTKRLTISLAVVLCVWISATGSEAFGATVINLTGSLDVGTSFDFTADGLTVTATGEDENGNARYVVRSLWGLGVYRGGLESPLIDGVGPDETLWLAFDQLVSLEKACFTFVDYRGDEARLVDHDGNTIIDVMLSPGVLGTRQIDFSSIIADPNALVGTVFGFRPTDCDDDFKLKRLEVTIVPLPEAALSGLGLLAGLGVVYRLRRQA